MEQGEREWNREKENEAWRKRMKHGETARNREKQHETI